MNNSPKNSLHQEECLPKCGVCHNNILDKSIYQPDPSLPIICSECHQNFTEEEVFLMTNLFTVYGGYFGQERSTEFSLITSLENCYNEPLNLEDFDEINARCYHSALLHGISLQECSNKLKIFFTTM